jgi:hypothetical protein
MNNKLPGIVSLSIFSAIVVIFWIFFGVYRAITAKPTPQVSAQIIEPITPTLDSNAIKNLGERVYIDQSQIPQTSLINQPEINISTSEAQITTQEVPATNSGEVNQ